MKIWVQWEKEESIYSMISDITIINLIHSISIVEWDEDRKQKTIRRKKVKKNKLYSCKILLYTERKICAKSNTVVFRFEKTKWKLIFW